MSRRHPWSSREIEKLFEVIGKLKKEGVTVIYISHHLDEIFRITDSITVLRDSRMQGDIFDRKHLRARMVSLMIGKELKDFYPKEEAVIGDTVLEVEDVYSGTLVKGAKASKGFEEARSWDLRAWWAQGVRRRCWPCTE